ncbi:hypothetical protein THC_0815 [Caldimicrobium thiodismutans]|jgi:tRNA threonylcarbamoyladenosine biosynthesis protein TsaB|uniref:Gcp-like domain-containing protein n=1 Tax=Caldimicrobium thiodismutans TaxID=1653476 RepID=A0A0U5BX04_9BACT|nr:tRNA (adenosine(37)-N6)-threonylcarbamoyltransferase complex dimerization subunit type 1 TsaB [Caldimicrobium thiodismutans]BAU23205.1 hypothetical protein THC_0815 [Caldimicrobium thiodismutans]
MEAPLKKEPLILAIETSGKFGGLALYRETLLEEINFYAKDSYSKRLFQILPFLLDKGGVSLQEIDYLAVDIGPGSFTGLRIGLSLAKALSLVYDFPVLPLSSLEILAYSFYSSTQPIIALIDAYSKEVFVGIYKFEGKNLQTLIEPGLYPLKEIPSLIKEPTLFISETIEKWESFFRETLRERFLLPPFQPVLRAGLLSQVAKLKLELNQIKPERAEDILPLYLKASEAERKRCFSIS